MALSRETLDRIAERLTDPLAGVQAAVEHVAARQQAGPESLTKEAALALLENAVERWFGASDDVENLLLASLDGDNAADAFERLGGVALIHLAVAADVAKLAPIDHLGDNDLVSAADLLANPAVPSVIQTVTGGGPGEGHLLEAVTLLADLADDAGDDDVELPAREVLKELVDRAGVGVRCVLVGAAPSPHVAFLVVKPALEAALGAAPRALIQEAEHIGRSIARVVMSVVRRARDVLNKVLTEKYVGEIIKNFLERAKDTAQEYILNPITRGIVANILGEEEISEHIRHATSVRNQNNLRNHRNDPPPDNRDALKKLLKRNKRWVRRPVPIVARHLHPLWAVGPAAAPIAAALLLAWTILYTGDQLDSAGPFPNFIRPGLRNFAY